MIDDATWQKAKAALPIGTVTAVVIERWMPFGMFVRLPDFPGVEGVIDAISYRPGDTAFLDHDRWPPVGQVIEAVVADHVDRNPQFRFRVGRECWLTWPSEPP